MRILQDRKCLITGASRGLGAQIARSFWDAGANLMLIARSRDLLDELVAGFPKRTNQKVITFTADLGDPEAPNQIVAEANRYFESFNVIINNAAIQGPLGPAWETDWTEWQKTLQVNLLAPIHLCRLAIPWLTIHDGMAKRPRSKIINLSGGGATGPRANFTAYATAKAGLVRFSETLAEETFSLSIDINCVAPGAMNTAMLKTVLEAGPTVAGQREYEAALKVQQGSGASPERVAALCVFLASSASDGITGKLISAVWDPWEHFSEHLDDLLTTDIYTLRRIVPKDRSRSWGDQ
jgi:NAD(P)-dependent dehydrogenase (short-subunit alcohol dehydrogenase family)